MTTAPTDARRQALLDSFLRGNGTARDTGTSIRRTRRDRPLPLSFPQQRLWFLEQLRPGKAEYVVPLAWRLRGRLDLSALEAALSEIVRRHEVLRTRYRTVDGEPVQVIDEPAVIRLAVSGDREPADLIEEEARTRFDLGREAPLRARVVRIADEEHVLVLAVHHIAFDGWSAGVFARELGALYSAFAGGQPARLGPLDVQYADFATWQRERATSEVEGGQLEYWRSQLAGLTPLELSTDHPRPAVYDPRGATLPFTVPAELGRAVHKLGRAHGATPFMVLLAAFQTLLSRYTGSTDVAVGTPVAGRTRAETRNLLGFFVNTLVLRTNLACDPSFVDLLGRTRRTALGAYENQELPFERLVDELSPERDLSRNPLFQIMFALQNNESADFDCVGLRAHSLPTPWHTAKFDLTMHLTEERDGSLSGVVEFATALFDHDTMLRLAGHYRELLAAIATDPSARLSRLAFLTDGERRQLTELNDTAIDYPTGLCLHDMFAEQVTNTPDAPAVVANDVELSYVELEARANRLAHRLRTSGVGPESVVGVCLHRSAELVVALLGVLKAGAAYLPLDPGYPAERLAFMLDDSAARVVITNPDLASVLGSYDGAVVGPDADSYPADEPPALATTDNAAYVIYTSGSTGRPKGVVVPHRGVVNRIQWMQDTYRLDATDRVLQKTPYSFDVSVWEFFWPLATGATLIMARPDGHRDPAYLAEVIAQQQITTVHFVPSMLRAFLAEGAGLPSLRRMICSGEALTADLVAGVHELIGCELHNLYGPTEASIDVTAIQCDPDTPVTIGRPIANTATYIVDGSGNPVPVGVPGELMLAGVQLARGYLGRPELTAERFVPNPFATTLGERLYRTGDLTRYRPDGTIDYLGRLDHQVKIRGHRIELGEIEAALAMEADIDTAIVTVHGEIGEQQLVAYVIGRVPDVAELRTRLPDHLIPAVFVPITELPLTSSGKVDRTALPIPGPDRRPTGQDYTPPRTPAEHTIASAFGTAIGLDAVGVHDRFFDLGGDSIRAVRVVGALRAGGMNVSVQDLFRHQTVAELAAAVAPRDTGADDVRTEPFELLSAEDRERLPDGLADAYPLSMVQAGMAYEMLADPVRGLYLNSLTYPIRDDAPLCVPSLRAAAEILVRRHEVLRTAIDLTSYSEPVQLVYPSATIEVSHGFPAGEPNVGFDLSIPCLLRLHAHETGERTWLLSVVYSHPILDGWSQNSLVTELLGHYRAIRDGREPNPAEAPTVRFADSIALERRSLDSADDHDFWASRVAEAERLTIPQAWAGPGTPVFRDIRVPFADLMPDLRALASAAGVPLKAVLFAAHLTVLGMIRDAAGDAPTFHTGLVTNVRPELADGDQVRGMFLNTVPFVARLEAPSWVELARSIFAEETAIWPHRHHPLPAMQRAWGKGTALVDVFFNHTDMHVLDAEAIDLDGIVDTTPNEFGLSVSTVPGMLIVEASSDRIGDEHLDLLARRYRHALETMVAEPEARPLDCRLPDPERTGLLERWNPPATGTTGATLPELFAQQVGATPHEVAVIAGGYRLSYVELDARSNQLANHLRDMGVGPGSLVGVFLDRGADLVIALLAVLKVGGAYVPLDPDYPADRVAFMLSDTDSDVLITQSSLRDKLSNPPGHVVLVDADRTRIATRPGATVGHTPDPDELAYIIYTSGSTGTPKGVMISHRGLANFCLAMLTRPGLEPGATVLGLTTVSFDPSVLELYLPLLVGACVVVAATEETRDPQRMAGLITDARPTLLQATPVTLRMLLDAGWSAPAGLTILCGGEKLPPELAGRLSSGGAQVWDLYGPTETTVWTTSARLDRHGQVRDWATAANTRVQLLDERLEPVPVGVIGEVYIGGSGVAWGYRGRPALTAEKFIPDPHSAEPGRRLYRTGDLARRHPDGRVEVLGRADHQVKIRGHRIEPAEIEAALLDHPAVRACAVHPFRTGNGQPELAAYLVPRDGHPSMPAAEELRSFLGRTLPDYMAPAAFVVLDALPLTPSGKVNRKRLPVPELTRTVREHLPPRTPTERVVADAWIEVLGRNGIGVHENFFDIGGHSLLATRVAVRLRAALGVDVPVRALFDRGTIAALADALPGYPSLGEQQSAPALVPRRRAAAARNR